MVNKNDHITNVTNLNPIIYIYIYIKIAINLVLQFFSHDYRHPKGSGSR